MTIEANVLIDPYLVRLKKSLSASAVLKAELGAAKASSGGAKIFAYEGIDDKVIYSHWLSKIEPKLEYEPFVCRNKSQLLQLWKSLKSDLTGMNEDVYFFTDRDFDDLKGGDADSSIFVTEKYSVENYLVDNHTLKELLKVELHCHGAQSVREDIVKLFECVYDEFLAVSAEVNFRIYVARKCNIQQIDDIEIRLDDLADIRIDSVSKGGGAPDQMVPLEREPSANEVDDCRPSFNLLNRRDRYRGKFALQFFRKWLTILVNSRNSADSDFFRGLPQGSFVAKGGFSFDQLAAKSNPPGSLRDFIRRVMLVHRGKAVA